MISQRDDWFNGGIKQGMVAGDFTSKILEHLVRVEIDRVRESTSLHWESGIKGNHSMCGCYPDGGIFVDNDGFPLIAFECKKQGRTGNAIERWYKNYFILKAAGIKRYVTFCAGDGFDYGSSAYKTLMVANVFEGGNVESLWDVRDSLECPLAFYRYDSFEDPITRIHDIIKTEVRPFA